MIIIMITLHVTSQSTSKLISKITRSAIAKAHKLDDVGFTESSRYVPSFGGL